MGQNAREEGREVERCNEKWLWTTSFTQLTGQSGQMTPILKIKVSYATRELDNLPDTENTKELFTLGTRVLFTCNVTGLSEGNEVVSYRWFRNCTGGANGRCQIRDEDPYYKVVKNNLLVDVASWDQEGRYSCSVRFNATPVSTTLTSIRVAGWLSLMMQWTIWYVYSLHHWSPHR